MPNPNDQQYLEGRSANGTSTEEHELAAYPDHSYLPLDSNGEPIQPVDTVPWCPEDDYAGVVPMHGAGMDPVVPKNHRLPELAYGSYTAYTANGTDITQNVGFPVNAAIVWNYSPQWVLINETVWVPPFHINGVVKFPSAGNQAGIDWDSPTGVTQGTSVSGALCVVQFCEEPLSPHPFEYFAPAGSPSGALNTSQVSVTTGTSILAANGARRTATVFNTAAAGGNVVYIGATSGVTTSTGGAIPPQGSITLSNYSGAIFGSATGGSATTVTVTEESA